MGIVEKVRREPVLVTTLVAAVIMLLVSFHVPITDEQTVAINGLILAVMAFFARGKVKPVRKAEKYEPKHRA